MDVVFITRNELGLACLQTLQELGANIPGIFTRPQREDVSDQTELHEFAEQSDVNLHEVTSVNEEPVIEQIRDYSPDLLFVVGWSRLVTQQVIDLPTEAALGMHPAPLPRGRGRAPIAWNLIKGLDETALSMFHLVEEADAGDIVGQQPIPIDRHDDAASLYSKVVEAGTTLIREHYPAFAAGNVPRAPQNDDDATWWPQREPHHGIIDWTQSAEAVYNWIRGQTHPYPGAFSYINGRKVRVWGANPPTGEQVYANPGEILETRDGTLVVAAWEESIELTTVQVENDSEMEAETLLETYDIKPGDQFTNLRDKVQE